MGCEGAPDPDPVPQEPGAEAADPQPSPTLEGEWVYERSLVFVSELDAGGADSTVVIPWTFRSLTAETAELRERGVWLGEVDGWESLAMEADTAEAGDGSLGPTWRILPGPRVRIVVGPGDALETLILRGEAGELEVRPGTLLSEWTRPPREAIRIHRGSAVLPAGVLDGFVADLALPLGSLTPPDGDWIFVHGGDRLQAVLVQQPDEATDGVHLFRGWIRTEAGDETWPGVQVRWDELRAYEPARRDVPVRWLVQVNDHDPDADPEAEEPSPRLAGYLETMNSHLAVGEGEGPLLPVHGLFRLQGELVLDGDTIPVTGVARHRQP